MKMSRTLKYITTFSLFLCYFFYGVNFYVVGPTLIELAALFNTTIERICFIYTVRSAGYTLGSLSGFLFNHINRQLAFVFFMALMGLTLILMPHCSSLFQLFSLGAINGFSIGSFDTAINVWILEIWGSESGPYMQALHFTYGLGSFVAPLICEPFLSSKKVIGHHIHLSDLEAMSFDNDSSLEVNNGSDIMLNETEFITDEEMRSHPIMIFIPYALAGAVSIAGALSVLVLYFYKKYEPPVKTNTIYKVATEDKDLKTNNKYSKIKFFIERHIPPLNTVWLVSCGFIFLTFFVGMEQMHLQFLPTFAINSDLNMSPSAAALVTSGTAAAFTIGRALSILLAIKIRPQTILYSNHVMMFSGVIILAIYAHTSEVMMWVGNILIGAGFSSVYASFYAFLEQQFQVTNVIGSVFVFAGGLTAALSPSVVGAYIEANPLILVWFDLLCVSICLAVLVIVHITIYTRLNKKNAKVFTTEDDDAVAMKMLAQDNSVNNSVDNKTDSTPVDINRPLASPC